MQSCSSPACQTTPKSISVCSTEFSGTCLFPFSTSQTQWLYSGKAGLWLLRCYLFIKYQFEMHVQEGFLFNFQMKLQVKTHAFFCSSLFIFSFLPSFKARLNNAKITLMLSIFEVFCWVFGLVFFCFDLCGVFWFFFFKTA